MSGGRCSGVSRGGGQVRISLAPVENCDVEVAGRFPADPVDASNIVVDLRRKQDRLAPLHRVGDVVWQLWLDVGDCRCGTPHSVGDRLREAERLGRQLKLSAGMSADMDAAIAAGTDIVRVGTSIMGKRPVG